MLCPRERRRVVLAPEEPVRRQDRPALVRTGCGCAAWYSALLWARNPATGDSHAVQVKTGASPINQAGLKRATDLRGWVIFSTTKSYRGKRPRHVEQLDRDDLLRFMTERHSALPPIVDTWLDTTASAG